MKISRRVCLISGLFVFASLNSSFGLATEESGECAEAFGAKVCTWINVEGGKVTEIGATIPLKSIEGAADNEPMVWPPAIAASVGFPRQLDGSIGMTDLSINWEPMGHGPATYLTPHFDFHFNLIPSAERLAIDCKNEKKTMTPPAGYGLPDQPLPPELVELTGKNVLIGSCVPEMGMHAMSMVDAESQELFNNAMIVGYYDGKPIFFEPMVSREMLQRRQSFSITVPTVPGLDKQPTEFNAIYLEDGDTYRMSFSGF